MEGIFLACETAGRSYSLCSTKLLSLPSCETAGRSYSLCSTKLLSLPSCETAGRMFSQLFSQSLTCLQLPASSSSRWPVVGLHWLQLKVTFTAKL